jgi:prepilin-type processing-associated H-X9-DG protein
MMVYAADNEGWLPPRATTQKMNYSDWAAYLMGSAKERIVATSTGTANEIPLQTVVYVANGWMPFRCPSRKIKRTQSHIYDYGMNERMTYSDESNPAVRRFPDALGVAAGAPYTTAQSYLQYNSNRTLSPSLMYLIADTRDDFAGFNRLTPLANSIREDLGSVYNTALGYEHQKSANMIYHDGHVELLTPQTTPAWAYSGSNWSAPWLNRPGHSSNYPNDGIPRD